MIFKFTQKGDFFKSNKAQIVDSERQKDLKPSISRSKFIKSKNFNIFIIYVTLFTERSHTWYQGYSIELRTQSLCYAPHAKLR